MYFVSYSRRDSEFVLRLVTDLRRAGADLWLDQLDIPAGKPWHDEIQAALETCAGVLAILSPRALGSRNVKDEIFFALDEEKTILPVVYKQCKIPFWLRRYQQATDFSAGYEKGLGDLLRALELEAPEPEAASTGPINPTESDPNVADEDTESSPAWDETLSIPSDIPAPVVARQDPTVSESKPEQYGLKIAAGLLVAALAALGVWQFVGSSAPEKSGLASDLVELVESDDQVEEPPPSSGEQAIPVEDEKQDPTDDKPRETSGQTPAGSTDEPSNSAQSSPAKKQEKPPVQKPNPVPANKDPNALVLKDPSCKPTEWVDERGIEWISVCAGTFTMGAPADEPGTEDRERPQRRVTLPAFSMMKFEVTHKQYKELEPNHKSWWDERGRKTAQWPVTNVTWQESVSFCQSVKGRLPTEAEWEYSARAGTTTPWSFGSDEGLLKDYAVFGAVFGFDVRGEPATVGSKKPNPWGFYDLHGNVWEWVQDWYGPYPTAAEQAPTGPESGEYRVLRGGSCKEGPWDLRSACRLGFRFRSVVRYEGWGFRCVRVRAA